jgi:hypothetical protein
MNLLVALGDDTLFIDPDQCVLYSAIGGGLVDTNINMQIRLIGFFLEAINEYTVLY